MCRDEKNFAATLVLECTWKEMSAHCLPADSHLDFFSVAVL